MTPLPVLFAAHKTAVLGAAAAGVAGVALLQKRKKTTTGTAAAASPAGTIPAAAVVPSSGVQGAFPDTSATDVYNQLEGQLERLQANGSQAVPVPTPVASSLYAPSSDSNTFVRYGPNGMVTQVEADGSQLGLTYDQWQSLAANGAQAPNIGGPAPTNVFTTLGNLTKVSGGTAG